MLNAGTKVKIRSISGSIITLETNGTVDKENYCWVKKGGPTGNTVRWLEKHTPPATLKPGDDIYIHPSNGCWTSTVQYEKEIIQH